MTKVLLLFSVLTILISTQTFAQCKPTSFPGPELTYPDTNMGIAPAAESQYYEQLILMRIPADTVFSGVVFLIDSIGITSITGLPSSLTWATDKDNNYWPGNSFGCIVFQGTPAVGDAGDYKIEIKVNVNAFGNSLPYTLEYNLEVLDVTYVGLNGVNDLSFKVLQNQPNPFDNYTQINYVMPNAAEVKFSVYNILGNKVVMRKYNSIKGQNSIKFDRENLANGIYIYELTYGESVIRKRMVIR